MHVRYILEIYVVCQKKSSVDKARIMLKGIYRLLSPSGGHALLLWSLYLAASVEPQGGIHSRL